MSAPGSVARVLPGSSPIISTSPGSPAPVPDPQVKTGCSQGPPKPARPQGPLPTSALAPQRCTQSQLSIKGGEGRSGKASHGRLKGGTRASPGLTRQAIGRTQGESPRKAKRGSPTPALPQSRGRPRGPIHWRENPAQAEQREHPPWVAGQRVPISAQRPKSIASEPPPQLRERR
ncbi:hypothetical protein NDU88_009799 [Pleurodeles waltl]|uniref:Uncharacterized protein n=1 Tax=Pleurodeles waltl TaxID=8319 RepID=A0AAV7S0R2_PLEWA|nr:hypothetical protein NDU88_009799 [Pleurodeles waltl]